MDLIQHKRWHSVNWESEFYKFTSDFIDWVLNQVPSKTVTCFLSQGIQEASHAQTAMAKWFLMARTSSQTSVMPARSAPATTASPSCVAPQPAPHPRAASRLNPSHESAVSSPVRMGTGTHWRLPLISTPPWMEPPPLVRWLAWPRTLHRSME